MHARRGQATDQCRQNDKGKAATNKSSDEGGDDNDPSGKTIKENDMSAADMVTRLLMLRRWLNALLAGAFQNTRPPRSQMRKDMACRLARLRPGQGGRDGGEPL